jgi:hypothetical protein
VSVAPPLDDEALRQQLIAGSPWRMNWEAVGRTEKGEMVLAFTEEGGKFKGNLVSMTGVPEASWFVGEVRFLTVKSGKVSFTTLRGGDYELSLNPEGRIGGTGKSGRGAPLKFLISPDWMASRSTAARPLFEATTAATTPQRSQKMKISTSPPSRQQMQRRRVPAQRYTEHCVEDRRLDEQIDRR